MYSAALQVNGRMSIEVPGAASPEPSRIGIRLRGTIHSSVALALQAMLFNEPDDKQNYVKIALNYKMLKDKEEILNVEYESS